MKKFSIAVMWDVASISPERELEALWRLHDRCAELVSNRTPEVVLAGWWDLDNREKSFRSFRGARKIFHELQELSPSSYSFSLSTLGQGTSKMQMLQRNESRPYKNEANESTLAEELI
jgi:predicted acyl esterase